MKKRRIFVVCPGRGSYTKESLGYLNKYKSSYGDIISFLDGQRKKLREPTISEMDSAPAFKTSLHTKGENASSLIYTCSYLDFLSIDQNRYEVVAVAGNSMGWYLSLAMGGALDEAGAFQVVNTMGSMMRDGLIGGQIIYPVMNEEWQRCPEKIQLVFDALAKVSIEHPAYLSIDLGGYFVLAGDDDGLKKLVSLLPREGDYPFKLINHGAFHTPLLHEISTKGFDLLPRELLKKPQIPLIDGRGHIWAPYSTNIEELYYYTLGYQVVEPYDFTTSVKVGLKEFNPDHVVLLGPGNSLGGAIGQVMIDIDWHGLKNKEDFINRQSSDALLVSMGLEEQRKFVTKA